MTRFWMCHWQNRTWQGDVNTEFRTVKSSGSNSFRKRGVSAGDVAYVVSLAAGQLYLGGRMTVKQVVSRRQAVRLLRTSNLYDAAEWIVDPDESGTPQHLHRRLASTVTRQIRCMSPKSEPKELFFVSDTHLDNQATRGVRELTPESAALFDRIIEVTEMFPRTGETITVTEEMLRDDTPPRRPALTGLCIYTIKQSDDLRASLAKGGRDTYCEAKKWAKAKELLNESKQTGQRLPVLFAPAEGTAHLFAWALLDEVILGDETKYRFSDLRLFDPQPLKSILKKANGEPLDQAFIRPYAICQTPDYLTAVNRTPGDGQGEADHASSQDGDRSETVHHERSASAFPNGFHPLIDRFDIRSAAGLFRWLWPNPAVSAACARFIADSIRTAHEAGNASWAVTMHANSLRLNVGQVETLTLVVDNCRVLFRAPLEIGPDQPFEINLDKKPIYAAVPVPSGVCAIPAAHFTNIPPAVRKAHDAYIHAAASYKRGSPHRKAHSPAVLEYLEAVSGEPLPRPSWFDQAAYQRVNPLPDELDAVEPIREGAKYQVTVNVYERDPEARRLCIAEWGTSCVICGFSFGARYGEVAEGLIHVHHLRLLSEAGEEYEVDPVADLRPVCPNCHAVLHHRRDRVFDIEEVRAFLRK